MDDRQKILYSSLNFFDAADVWFQIDAVRFTTLSRLEFSHLLQYRFSEDLSHNVIGEFKNLCQKGTIVDYQEHFEQLRPLVLLQNPGLSEKYFIDSCIAGLRDDIRHPVQMFYPNSVQNVFALARLQEAAIDQKSKHRYSKEVAYSKPQQSAQPPIKRLTSSEIQDRRAKGLCYNCDEVWTVKHRCKGKQLFLIVGDIDDTTELSDTASNPAPSDSSAPAISAEVAISLHALSGNASYQTLLLKGKVRNRSLTMLVDTGSTHNFLDINTAKALGCICSDTPAQQVMVAGGTHLTCDKICQNFCWDIKDVQFSSDVRLLSLGGCDLVLGVQWLKSIGPITMDFSKLQL